MIISIEDIVKQEFEKAKLALVAAYEKEMPKERGAGVLPSQAILVLKTGEVLEPYDFSWETPEQKRKRQVSVALLAAFLDAAAVITTNEGCLAHFDMKKEPFTSMSDRVQGDRDKFMRLANEWRIKRFGPSIANMPDKYMRDSLVVNAITESGHYSCMTSFQRNKKPIVFEDYDLSHGETRLNIVPPWWSKEFWGDRLRFIEITRAQIPSDMPKNEVLHTFEKAMDRIINWFPW